MGSEGSEAGGGGRLRAVGARQKRPQEEYIGVVEREREGERARLKAARASAALSRAAAQGRIDHAGDLSFH